MIFKNELVKMQTCYNQKRLKDIKLKYPTCLIPNDPMASIFKDKSNLLQYGNIYYACILQANEILFKRTPKIDCPAQIVYSMDPYVSENPSILYEIAGELYRYKYKPLQDVPYQWREMVRVIADEVDRSDFTFSVEHNGKSVEIKLMPTIIFRKLLPKRKLCGRLLPIIAMPDCKSVMVLPKRFWTKIFRACWIKNVI